MENVLLQTEPCRLYVDWWLVLVGVENDSSVQTELSILRTVDSISGIIE